MTWLFKRRIKIATEVKISIGKSKTSKTFGIQELQFGAGEEFSYLNTGVSGMGIFNRKKVKTGNFKLFDKTLLKKLKRGNTKIHNPKWYGFFWVSLVILIPILIFGKIEHWFLALCFGLIVISTIATLLFGNKNPWIRKKSYPKLATEIQKELKNTEDNSLKKSILKSYIHCLKLSRQAGEKENIINALRIKYKKTSRVEYLEALTEIEAEYKGLEKQLDSVQFNADEGLTADQKELFAKVVEKFESLINSEKKWQTILDKKPANPLIREKVNFYLGLYAFIKSEFPIPIFTDSDYNFYYLYPKFIIKAFSQTKFEVFDLSVESFREKETQFIEKEKLPKDAKVLDKSYALQTADKSEKTKLLANENNPVVLYGDLNFPQLNLNYLISNVTSATDFNGYLKLYLQLL